MCCFRHCHCTGLVSLGLLGLRQDYVGGYASQKADSFIHFCCAVVFQMNCFFHRYLKTCMSWDIYLILIINIICCMDPWTTILLQFWFKNLRFLLFLSLLKQKSYDWVFFFFWVTSSFQNKVPQSQIAILSIKTILRGHKD